MFSGDSPKNLSLPWLYDSPVIWENKQLAWWGNFTRDYRNVALAIYKDAEYGVQGMGTAFPVRDMRLDKALMDMTVYYSKIPIHEHFPKSIAVGFLLLVETLRSCSS